MRHSLYMHLLLGSVAMATPSYDYVKLSDDLGQQLKSNLSELRQKDTLPLYFGAYRIHDSAYWNIVYDQGKIFSENQAQRRWGEVELRIGTPEMDQTHPLPDDQVLSSAGFFFVPLSNADDAKAYNRRMWRIGTEQAFRSAKERFSKVQHAVETQRQESAPLPDWVPAPIHKDISNSALPKIDTNGQGRIKAKFQNISQLFNKNQRLHLSQLIFEHKRTHRLLVNTEGNKVLDRDSLSTLLIVLTSRHQDGSDISLVDTRSFRDLPTDAELQTLYLELDSSIKLIDSIYQAPLLEPYAGPVLLEGRGAAVFLHEILGHRVESDRFRLANDGQTFLAKLNQSIFPPFISINDNPRLRSWDSIPLNGYYKYDDEGTLATGTQLVKNGILTNFLSNRSPALVGGKSSGNARAIFGVKPMARMSNLQLTSSQSTPDSLLRTHLIAMAKEQGLPYALVIKDLSGGFTNTTRYMPQAFKLTPYYVVQVFVDGRPDRIARGLDLAGTPLVSLSKIKEVGTTTHVFNGFCGAESGWMPVSALSPGLLFDKLEFQKQELQSSRPPFLSAPRAQ